ncbi:MAG: acyl carrier protein [Candidatus Omnitrophota bacterium]
MEPMEALPEGQIKKDMKNFIKENFLLGNDSTLNDDDSFMAKGIIDSTGILEVVSFVEKTFGFRIEDDELLPDNLDSLNNLTSFIARKQGK